MRWSFPIWGMSYDRTPMSKRSAKTPSETLLSHPILLPQAHANLRAATRLLQWHPLCSSSPSSEAPEWELFSPRLQ